MAESPYLGVHNWGLLLIVKTSYYNLTMVITSLSDMGPTKITMTVAIHLYKQSTGIPQAVANTVKIKHRMENPLPSGYD